MKTLHIRKTFVILGALALPMLASAANITLTASDASGHTSLSPTETQLKWSDGLPPNPTNDYFTGPFFVRTPGGTAGITFAGHSLTLGDVSGNPGTGGQGAPFRSILYKGGGGDTITINNLTNLAGSVLNNGGSGNTTAPTFTGNQWTIAGNSTIISDQGPTIIGYPIFGSANLTNSGSVQSGVHPITYTGSLAGFTGRLILAQVNGGMVVNLNAGSGNLGNPATFTPDQISIAVGCALTDNTGITFNNPNGGFTLTGNASINSAASTVIAEPITDNGNNFNLTFGGSGTIKLSTPSTYTGGTIISGGTLQIGVANALVNTSPVTDNALLDLNGTSITIDALSGSGNVDTQSGGTPTLTVGANGGSGTLTGTINNSAGTLSLTKIGAGTETLSGGYFYSGSTVVAGGVLGMVTSGSLPSTPGNMTVSNGATLSVDVSLSPGTSLPANNLVFGLGGGNVTNNINYGTVTANPTVPVINATGGISAPASTLVINIAATGLQPGKFTLIKYTGTALASIANFQVSPPPGVAAVLSNNTANDSIDLVITSIPNQLTWNGANGGAWDLTTPNWLTPASVLTAFQQYTNNGVVAGDAVTFNDTDVNNETNITLNSTFAAFPVVVNSAQPYSVAGTGGITGPTSLALSGTGTFTLLTSNSFTGGVNIANGGLVISNDSALGAPTVGVTLNGGVLEYIGSSTNLVRPFSMPVLATVGVSTNNTVRLGGVISGAGASFNKSDNGTLVLAGKETFTGDLFLHGGFTVIDTGGAISNGSFHDVGQNGNDAATLTIQGTGSLKTTSDFNLGDLDNSTGTLNMTGSAVLTMNQFFVGSANATGSTASGVVNQSGGTITEVSTAVGAFAIGGRTSTSGVGVYNMNGGTVIANAGVRVGGTGIGTLNMNLGTFNALQGLNIARIAGSFGTNNLNGGTLATFNVASSTSSNAIFNFNGGTLQAAFNPPTPWMFGLSSASVLAGGAIIDSSNFNVTINQPLLAGSPNGGLTKKGVGTLTLTGVNTFTGPITNTAGLLFLNSASTYTGAVSVNAGTLQATTASVFHGNTTVSNNAVLSVVQIGSADLTLGNLTFNGAATGSGATLGLTPTTADNPNVALVDCGTLTLNGTNTISLAAVKIGTLALIQYTGALAGSGNITNLSLPQGATGFISNNAASSTLFAVITSTGPGLVWTGTNTVSPNIWDIGITTNWLVNSTPTSYHQIISPGDSVTFTDSGSGTVTLNTNVAPTSLLISNNNTAYTLSGSGSISGPTGLQMVGSGTAILRLTNDSYLGDTAVSNGTLQLGSATAISSAANLDVGTAGTLELAGISPTVGELTGSGIIDNASGINPILTVGTSTGGTWNGTIQDHGAGGATLHKVGSGTWVVGGTNHFNDGQPFSDQTLISDGEVDINSGGLFSVANLQLRIGDTAGQSASVVVAGGTLAVSNNVLSVGYGANTASGTLTVNNGTVFHGGPAGGDFAAVTESIDVGAQGAVGVLTVNGGQVLNDSLLYLGDGAGASGTLQLNGGLVQAIQVLANAAPTTSVANFNGGTLQAVTNSDDFIDSSTVANIQTGGLILDDGGWAITLPNTLQADPTLTGGGLVKKGSGFVYLDGNNAYTGTTLITNGTLAGVGSITGPVVVAPAGTIGSGDTNGVGTLTLNSSLTIQGTASLRVNKTGGTRSSDSLTSPNVAYGGTLAINNITTDGTLLVLGDQFTVFNATAHSGNFASVTGSAGSGLGFSFNPTTGIATVVTAAVIAPNPTNVTFSVSGNKLSLSWPADHLGWILQAQTNALSVGLQSGAANWFDVAGSATVTSTNVTVSPASPTVYYRLRHP